jgi:hypothetical protein
MTNSAFKITPRKNWMIATPFVLNDAVIVKEQIKANSKPNVLLKNYRFKRTSKDSLNLPKDTIR